jgi:hypothetical protein
VCVIVDAYTFVDVYMFVIYEWCEICNFVVVILYFVGMNKKTGKFLASLELMVFDGHKETVGRKSMPNGLFLAVGYNRT